MSFNSITRSSEHEAGLCYTNFKQQHLSDWRSYEKCERKMWEWNLKISISPAVTTLFAFFTRTSSSSAAENLSSLLGSLHTISLHVSTLLTPNYDRCGNFVSETFLLFSAFFSVNFLQRGGKCDVKILSTSSVSWWTWHYRDQVFVPSHRKKIISWKILKIERVYESVICIWKIEYWVNSFVAFRALRSNSLNKLKVIF